MLNFQKINIKEKKQLKFLIYTLKNCHIIKQIILKKNLIFKLKYYRKIFFYRFFFLKIKQFILI